MTDLHSAQNFEAGIRQALGSGFLSKAQALAYQWLRHFSDNLPANPSRADFLCPQLWLALADVVERTSDHYLTELLWQILEQIPLHTRPLESLPLLGIPILNRADLLAKLLDSLDVHVDTLAIVDNSTISAWQPTASQHSSGSQNSVPRFLEALQQLGHPLIGEIRVARPFSNLGVAASWNHILRSFADAPLALIANNDVVFAPGVLRQGLEKLNASRAQFMALFEPPNSFSAFFLTSLCWDRIGLFDDNFINAYFEDLEFRDRLRAHPDVEQIRADFAYQAMAQLNGNHSATIQSDPRLAAMNQCSYALNKLWYLSPRRLAHDRRGVWRRLWLSQWSPP